MDDTKRDGEQHFMPLELGDCKVPIGCPLWMDPGEDQFPDHHGMTPPPPPPPPCMFTTQGLYS